MKHTLITGSVRSGKSRKAVELAEASGRAVVFVATCEPGDDEMRERVRRHQDERPSGWLTLEEPLDLAGVIQEREPHEVVIVDCLTLWISNWLMQGKDETGILHEVEDLAKVLEAASCEVILVTNEVGWGIVPENALARTFRDVVGRMHQRLAQACDSVLLTVAGLTLKLKG